MVTCELAWRLAAADRVADSVGFADGLDDRAWPNPRHCRSDTTKGGGSEKSKLADLQARCRKLGLKKYGSKPQVACEAGELRKMKALQVVARQALPSELLPPSEPNEIVREGLKYAAMCQKYEILDNKY